jgi:DUF4097 and DUF4098 domain-containing protein YvlB
MGVKLKSLCAAVLFPAVLTTGCTITADSQGQTVHEEKRFQVSGTPIVNASTFDGTVQVQSWENSDVLVEIDKRGSTLAALNEIEVHAEQDGNAITLEARRPAHHVVHVFSMISASARLTVWVPKRSDIRVRSGDGSISIQRVNGNIEARTGDGTIRATDVSGTIDLSSGDGSIAVENAEGRLKLDTGDGTVNVSGRLTGVQLRTGDGSIIYRAEPGSAMNEDWDITTGDGTVTLYLPREFDAQLDAHTGDGGIRNDVDLSDTDARSRNTVRGRIGAGGRQLRIRTGDGSIRITPG